MSVSYNDLLSRYSMRSGANAPTLNQAANSINMQRAQAFLSGIGDAIDLIAQGQPNNNVATAVGTFLDALAAGWSVFRSAGIPATIPSGIVFSRSSPAPQPIDIPANTPIGTTADPTTGQAVNFQTLADTSIAQGGTTAAAVSAQATLPGVSGDVGVGTVILINANVDPSLSVTNTVAGQGGTDPDSDQTVRNAIFKAMYPKYGVAALRAAIIATAGVYDAYVADPQDGAGHVTYYWADASGSDSNTAVGAAVLANLGAVLEPDTLATQGHFTIANITALSATYSAPATVQSATIEPLMKQAIADYIQGNPTATPPIGGLLAGQVPTVPGLLLQMQLEGVTLGVMLTDFHLSSTTPAIGSPSPTTLYRLTGNPASVISLTRI